MSTKTLKPLKPLTDAELKRVVGGESLPPPHRLLKVGCGCGKH